MKKQSLVLVLLANAFIIYSQQLALDWVKELDVLQKVTLKDVAMDKDGNVYFTGYFQNTVDFSTEGSPYELTAVAYWEAFFAKYSPDLQLIWAKALISLDESQGYQIKTDSYNNIYISGEFTEAVDINPGLGQTVVTSCLDNDEDFNDEIFVLKLNSDGEYLWHTSHGSCSSSLSYSLLSIDQEDHLITLHKTSGIGYSLGKRNLNEELLWWKFLYYDQPLAMDTDSIGNIYLIGEFNEITDFDPGDEEYLLSPIGNSDMYVVKLNPTGDFLWAKNIGSANANTYVEDLAISADQEVTILGQFIQATDFDPGPSGDTLLASGITNYLLKLDANGDYLWSKAINSNSTSPPKLDMDQNDNIYLWGTFLNTVDFDPGMDTFLLVGGIWANNYLLQLSSSGDFIAVNAFESPNSSKSIEILLNSSNEITTIGRFTNSIHLDPLCENNQITSAGQQYFVQKLKRDPCGVAPQLTAPNNSCLGAEETIVTALPCWATNVSHIWHTTATTDTLNLLFDSTTTVTAIVNYQLDSLTCTDTLSKEIIVFDDEVEIPYNGLDEDCNETTLDDDLDQDGLLFAEDCDDNDPTVPGIPGTLCNDGNAETINDILHSDGCTCQGVHYDAAPILDWAFQLGNTQESRIIDMALDRSNNDFIYILGEFTGSVDMDPGSGEQYEDANSDGFDRILAKYNAGHELIWAMPVRGDYIGTDTLGNIYLAGQSGQISIDHAPGPETFYPASNNSLFVIKLNKDGGVIHSQQVSYNGTGLTAAITDKYGNTYFSGRIEEFIDFGSYEMVNDEDDDDVDIYLAKVDSAGNFEWGIQTGYNSKDKVYFLAPDDYGNIYLAGKLSAKGPPDDDHSCAFISKYDNNGSYQWREILNSDVIAKVEVMGVTVDQAQNVYVTGVFEGRIANAGESLISLEDDDFFITKINAEGDVLWGKSYDSGEEDIAYAIMSDSHNNIFLYGKLESKTIFESGENYLTFNNDSQHFLMKMDEEGIPIWTGTLLGGELNEPYPKLSVDDNDNVYLSGYFFATKDFDPNDQEFPLTATASKEAYVLKLRQECRAQPLLTSDPVDVVPCGTDSIQVAIELPLWTDSTQYYWTNGAISNATTFFVDSTSTQTVFFQYVDDGSYCTDSLDFEIVVLGNSPEIPYNGTDDDCDETTLDDDLDQDGFGIADDCDDEDATINPAVAEIPYNGINDDCDETTLDDDLDQDGYGLANDCDDEDATINPAVAEIPYNGVDDDCNEATLDDDLDQDGFGIADGL